MSVADHNSDNANAALNAFIFRPTACTHVEKAAKGQSQDPGEHGSIKGNHCRVSIPLPSEEPATVSPFDSMLFSRRFRWSQKGKLEVHGTSACELQREEIPAANYQ